MTPQPSSTPAPTAVAAAGPRSGGILRMAGLWPASGEDTDTPIWDTHHSSSEARDRSHVNDPRMDKLLEAQRTGTDDAKRREVLYEVQSMK